MARAINYVGIADTRIVSRADVLAHGLPDPGRDLVWDKDNGYEITVYDAIAVWLMAQGDFEDEADDSFGEVFDSTHEILGSASIQTSFTSTAASASPTWLPGAACSFEVKDRPVKVTWSGLWSNTTAGQGVQILLYRDAAAAAITGGILDDNATPSNPGANIPTAVTRVITKTLTPGTHTYQLFFAKFLSGTATALGAANSPITLLVEQI